MDETSIRDGERAWYVVHTYSGYENKVKANLESKVVAQNLGDVIFDIVVPMHNETAVKDGKRKTVARKIFPGYVLVDMIVTDYSWYVVRNTQGVTGFVGSEKDPIPLTREEAENILKAMTEGAKDNFVTDIKVNDRVRITSGWLADRDAVVKDVDTARRRVKVLIGDTPVDLNLEEVEKY